MAEDAIINTENQMTGDSQIEVFDFKKNWETLVHRHLHNPEVEKALAHGMNAYRVARGRLSIALTGGPGAWVDPWDPEGGPLDNDSSDYWLLRCDELLDEAIERGEIDFKWPEDHDDEEAMDEAMEKHSELVSQFYPKRDSLEWYQLHLAGHYLAPWQRALGRLVHPELKWSVTEGDEHSLAYGEGTDGSIRVLFDILHFEEILRPSVRERFTVMDHINLETLDNRDQNLESRESQVFDRTAAGLLEFASRKRTGTPKTWTELLTVRPAAAFYEDGTIFAETMFRNQRAKRRQLVQTPVDKASLS